MKIGKLDLKHKLLVAPLADITDAAFRTIAKEFGAGLTFTQMVSAKGVVKNNFETLRLLVFSRTEKPIGVQLLGNDPFFLRGAVNELKNLQPDVIDFNCGCPVDKVTKHNMGASLLDDTKKLGDLIREMVAEAGDMPISVKLRLGKDTRNINIIDNVKAAQDNGAAFVTVHARTKVDRYDEEPKWEWITKVKDSIQIPVVANGSIFTPNDAKNIIENYGADSVMVARGALGNPFIFAGFNKLMEFGTLPEYPTPEEIKDVAIKHINLLVQDYGEANGINKVKKHIIWYFRNLPALDQLIDKIFACKNRDELIELISFHYKNIKTNNYESDAKENFNKLFNSKVQFWLSEEDSIVK